MLLNVKKGPYADLAQNSKSLKVSASETGTVERGICLYMDANGEWMIATSSEAGDATTPGAFIYFALQGSDDLTAQMAGGTPTSATAQAKIAAIGCSPSLEIETDMFAGTPALNDNLAVGDDGLLEAHADGETIIAQVTSAAADRWVNNAAAVAGWRTGNNVSAISVVTMYVPCVTTT
jgi:hypothetical protein